MYSACLAHLSLYNCPDVSSRSCISGTLDILHLIKNRVLISTLGIGNECLYIFVLQELSPIETHEPFTGRAGEPECEEENPQFFTPAANSVCPVDQLENHLTGIWHDYPPT